MSTANWTTPNYPFTGAQYVDWNKIPKSVGMDLFSGKRDIDLYKTVLESSKKPSAEGAIPSAPAQYDTKDATPSIQDIVKANIQYQTEMLPIELQRQAAQTDLTRQLNIATMSDLFPFLSAAGAESTARNLAASKSFLATKEQMPSSVQAIMASKQGQMLQAASGEAERQRATAAQQEAAKRFAGSFAGQYIQVA
jgi:hypothetical protein